MVPAETSGLPTDLTKATGKKPYLLAGLGSVFHSALATCWASLVAQWLKKKKKNHLPMQEIEV